MPQSYMVPDDEAGLAVQLPPRNWGPEPWGEVIVRLSAPRGDVKIDHGFFPPNPELKGTRYETGGPWPGEIGPDAHKHTFVIEGSNYQPSTFWIRKHPGQEAKPLVVGIEVRPKP